MRNLQPSKMQLEGEGDTGEERDLEKIFFSGDINHPASSAAVISMPARPRSAISSLRSQEKSL